MADETTTEVETDESAAERLMSLGAETKRKRGRPPGSKNRPKGEVGDVSVSQPNQRKIFAGALVALFSILSIIMAWFGYEYHKKIQAEEAEEGATYLLPISQKIGWIATGAFYLSFPAWLIMQVNERFRKVAPSNLETPATRVPGVSPESNGSSGVEASHSPGIPPSVNTPGFTAEPLN
jgi:hypothetical protein